MRRERFNLDISNVGWIEDDAEPSMPTLTVSFEGSASAIRERLVDREGELLDARETDVGVRLQGDFDDPDTEGVVAVTNRITGDYLIELNVGAADLETFTRAARRYGDATDDVTRYRVVLVADGEPVATYEKRTLLVYSDDGELLRQHSLIPSGVEI